MPLQTATNPKTGESVALIGGEWQPITQTATNPAGQTAYLVGGQWVIDDAAAPQTAPQTTPKPQAPQRRTSDSVLEGAKAPEPLATEDPMLRPEFVTAIERQLAALPADQRAQTLASLTQRGDVYGRAARVVQGRFAAMDARKPKPSLISQTFDTPEEQARKQALATRRQPPSVSSGVFDPRVESQVYKLMSQGLLSPEEAGEYAEKELAQGRMPQVQRATAGFDVEAMPEQFMSGVKGMQQGYYASLAANRGADLNIMDRIDRGERVPDADDPMGYQYMPPEARAKARATVANSFVKNVADVVAYGAQQKLYVKNITADRLVKAANDKQWGSAWEAFKSDPAGIIQQMSVQSAPNALPSLIGGAAGVLMRGGIPAMMAGLATGSFPVEYMMSIVDSLQDAEVNLADTAAVEAKLRDPVFLQEAGKKAVTRGVAIATADALGGRLAMPLQPKQLLKNIARGGANVVTEVGTEMGGEFAAQTFSNEAIKIGEIIAEGLGAGPTAIASTMLATVNEQRKKAPPAALPPTAPPGTRTSGRTEPTFDGTAPPATELGGRVEPTLGEAPALNQEDRLTIERLVAIGIEPEDAQAMVEKAAAQRAAQEAPPVVSTRLEDLTNEYIDAGLPPEQAKELAIKRMRQDEEADKAAEEGERRAGETVTPPSGEGAGMAGVTEPGAPAAGLAGTERTGVVPTATDVGQPAVGEGKPPSAVTASSPAITTNSLSRFGNAANQERVSRAMGAIRDLLLSNPNVKQALLNNINYLTAHVVGGTADPSRNAEDRKDLDILFGEGYREQGVRDPAMAEAIDKLIGAINSMNRSGQYDMQAMGGDLMQGTPAINITEDIKKLLSAETPAAPPAPAAPKTQEEILAAATDDELAKALTTYGGSEVGRLAPDLIQAEIAKRKAAAEAPKTKRGRPKAKAEAPKAEVPEVEVPEVEVPKQPDLSEGAPTQLKEVAAGKKRVPKAKVVEAKPGEITPPTTAPAKPAKPRGRPAKERTAEEVEAADKARREMALAANKDARSVAAAEKKLLGALAPLPKDAPQTTRQKAEADRQDAINTLYALSRRNKNKPGQRATEALKNPKITQEELAKAKADYEAKRGKPGAATVLNQIIAPVTNAFKRWFGNSKVVDAKGEPLVVYHGMPDEMDSGVFRESKYGTLGKGIYFTSDPEAAGRFATGVRGSNTEPKEQGNVVPVHLKIEQPFDDEFFVGNKDWQEWAASILTRGRGTTNPYWYQYTNWYIGTAEETEKILTALHDKLMKGKATLRDLLFVGDSVAEAPWSKEILEQVKAHGAFDGVILKNSPKGFDEYIVYKPNQIKSVFNEAPTSGPDILSQIIAPITDAFKRWFGDSKVVDKNGDPLVVYTGTSKDKDFSKFNVPKNGTWFTTDPEAASMYAKENDSQGFKYNPDTRRYEEVNTASRVIPVYVRIENPAVLSASDADAMRKATNYKKVQGQIFDRLRAQGYDGVNMGDGVWVVLGSPTQIKSIFNEAPTSGPDISRSVEARAQPLSSRNPSVIKTRIPSLSRFLNKLRSLLDKGKISESEFIARTLGAMDEVADAKAQKPTRERARGADRIIERLAQAKRQKLVSPELADLAIWFILQNPMVARGLGISIRSPRENEQYVGGGYTVASRIATIITGTSDSVTAVHEILHHIERMLPENVRHAILKSWTRALIKASKRATTKDEKVFFKLLLDYHFGPEGVAGGEALYKAAVTYIGEGKVPQSFYQYVDPSEFWAVNASNILQGRYDVQGDALATLKNWMSEFIERLKDIFGLQSNAPIIRGLKAALKTDGVFTTNEMLAATELPKQITPQDKRSEVQIIKEINKAIDGFENSSNATDIAEGVSLLQSFRNYDNFKAYFGGLYETLNGARLSTLLFFLTNDMAASWGGSYVPELLKTNKLLIDMRSASRKLLIGAKNLSDEMLRAISEDPSLKHKLERATAITTDVRVDPTSNTKFEQLNRIYDSLGVKGQALYRKLRDYYANILAAYEHLLDSQIDDAKLPPGSKQVLMAEIKKMYETDKKIVPFFPFVRNRGQLWLRVGKGDARRFYTFANAAERKAVMAYLAKEMKATPKQLLDDKVFKTGDSLEGLRRATSDMTTALKKIFEKIDEAVDPKELAGRVAVLTNTFKKEDPNLTDEEARAMAYEQAKEEATKDIKDTMYEMYLMVLPDQSFRKRFVSRQDIPGYNVDLIRNFATYATKISSQLPRIKYGPKLRTSLRTAEKFLDGDPDKAKLMRFVDEMTRRVDLDLNPYQTPPAGMSSTVLNALNTSVDFATRLAFVHYLSAAASAIVQATSFLYGASTLGARHGYARTAMEIGKMMLLWNEYGVQRQNEDGSITWHVPSVVNSRAVTTNPMEKRFVIDMMGAGIGEYTMTGEMLGRGAVSTAAFEGRGSKLGRGLMTVLGGPFQTVERLVQETLAVPAFRMNLAEGRKKGLTGEALYRYAADHAIADVYDGIGNMAESNRPPVLRNALGRFLMQFMVWPLIITFRWMRESYRMVTALSGGTVTAIKGLAYQKPQQLGFEPSEEKDAAVPALPTRTATEQFQAARLAFKEFAGIMGVTWMLAGVSGLPFFSTVLGFIAEWFEGEDEEKKYKTFKDMDYWTWWRTVWLPEYMGQIGIFGRPLTEVVGMGKEQLAALFERGPTNMLTGLDIASRTSINPTDMFSGQNKEVRTVREGALQFAEDRAGPFVGMILSYMDAYNAFADGDLQKGMEKMLPAIARNPAIAFKYYNEGIKDFRGSTILNKDSMTTGRVIYQAIGFRLDEVSNQQKFNFAVSKIENKIRFERENVLKNIRDSWIKKDFGRYRDWTEKAQAFNMRYPSYAIDIDDVDRSIEGAKERRGMAVRGFVPTEQNVPMFREAVLKRAEAMRRFEEKTKK